jgi:hypothetical protein
MLAGGAATRLRQGLFAVVLLALAAACGPTPTPSPTPEPPARMAVCPEALPVAQEAFASASGLVSLRVGSWQSSTDLVLSGYSEAALVWGPRPDVPPPIEAEALASDALAIVAHPRNRIGSLDAATLRDIFSGRTQQWEVFGQGLGAIMVVVREPGSGQYAALDALVMQGEPVSGNATIAAADGAVLDYVAARPSAIGFVAAGSLREGVRALTIEGVRPEPASVRAGLYPLMAGVWLVYRPDGGGEELRALLASDSGQAALDSRFASADLAPN